MGGREPGNGPDRVKGQRGSLGVDNGASVLLRALAFLRHELLKQERRTREGPESTPFLQAS